MSVVLELADVSRIHGQGPTQVRALDCVDLAVQEGELVAVMGPTGALTVLQLAAEAGVKRWVLTHKHPDLKTEVEQRRDATSSAPAAYRGPATRVTDLEAANHRLREVNSALERRVRAYAQAIYQISGQSDYLPAVGKRSRQPRGRDHTGGKNRRIRVQSPIAYQS